MDDFPASPSPSEVKVPPTTTAATLHAHDHDHDHDEHQMGFWQKYIFSSDHKVIGIQYLLCGLTFLFVGFLFVLMMRWQLAYPGEALTADNLYHHISYKMSLVEYQFNPFATQHPTLTPATKPAAYDPQNPYPIEFFHNGSWIWINPTSWLELFFGHAQMPDGVMTGDFYNSLGAMHGTIMVFLGIVPVGFAAFGNYVMPLQIGAPDMTFPRLNMASFWLFFLSGIIMFGSFFAPGGAAKSGWTSYSPLSEIADQTHLHLEPYIGDTGNILLSRFLSGQSLWLFGMVFNITASLLGSINFIATIIQLRTKGMTWMRLPFFVWTQLMTAFLLLLAFPPLEAAGVMQLMDRMSGSCLFLSSGMVVNGSPMHQYSGGGTPLLWQHLFWFLGHPEVYVLILPGFGIITEIIAVNSRKPIWGYEQMVYGLFTLGFLSMIVWAHHMYLTGMGTAVSAFFQLTTIIISVPTILIISSILISLWGGSIRFTTPMLWASAALPLFGIGGLTGIPLAFSAPDTYLHDTYYIIAHFHYVIAPGTMFMLFAGIAHWYPKVTGRLMDEMLGKIHFWPTMILMNCVFFPMFLQGMAGMHRRMYDGGGTYDLNSPVLQWNEFITFSAGLLGIVQLPFIFNFFWSIKYGKRVGDNPWEATTVEWTAPTPPPHGNFKKFPTVYRGPYEYSVPGDDKDYTPQTQPPKEKKRPDSTDEPESGGVQPKH